MPIIRNTRMAKALGIKRSREIMLLQGVVIAELLLDVATAFTVNHMDVVPAWVNGGLHWLFYLSIVTLVTAFYAYFMKSLQNHAWEKRNRRMVQGTFALSCVAVTACMPWVYYGEGVTTNYSYGLPVVVCFSMVAVILGLLAIELTRVWKEINGFQLATAMVLFISLFLVTLVQALWPEMLVSSLVPTFVIYSASMNMEDPQIMYQQQELERVERELQRINAVLREQREAEPVANDQDERNRASELPNPLKVLFADIQHAHTDGTFLYAEAEGNYIDVMFFDGERVRRQQIRRTMKQMEIALADYARLMRVHRAYIVNLDCVTHVAGNSQGYQLSILHTEQNVPVSRSYLAGFNEVMS